MTVTTKFLNKLKFLSNEKFVCINDYAISITKLKKQFYSFTKT